MLIVTNDPCLLALEIMVSQGCPSTWFTIFWQNGKLSPRFIRSFETLDKVGKATYRLALTLQLSLVHNIFYVSMLRKYQ